jgi:D-lactate dehydrogenase
MPKLRFITTMSTGFDHIDLEECKARNIPVSNVPSYGETVVAEHTFALLLAISRRIPESIERVKKGNFMPSGLTGFELRGKTIGVIGVGSIGTNVIRIARGFGMNVIVYKKSRQIGIVGVHIPFDDPILFLPVF